jgi:hypothetical protein
VPDRRGYAGDMNELTALTPGELVVLQSPPPEVMTTIVARLALTGPVCVLDAGNRYDAFGVARMIRHHSADLEKTLNRIHIARAFTCYQVLALFEQSPDTAVPYAVFDLTSTFEDESVRRAESYRLLRLVLNHVQRLRRVAPIVVSLRPPRNTGRLGLHRAVTGLADRVFAWETEPVIVQPTLF